MNMDLNPLLFSAPPALTNRLPYRDRYHDVAALQFLRAGDNTEDILNKSTHFDPNSPCSYLVQSFNIGPALGRGSFGIVFAVECKLTGRKYAVKRSKEAFRSPLDRHFKMKELRRFEHPPPHPNLLELHGAWQEDRYLYIQSEFCVSTLGVFCKSPLFTKPVLYYCSLDVITAVDHIHKSGLIHVDIKPENVLVTSEGICKLADFGGTYIPQEDKDSWDDGDCRYLSHDLMNNCPTTMTDVFSLGMTLFEIATQWILPKNGHQWNVLREGGFIESFLRTKCPEMAELVGAAVRHDPDTRATTQQLLNAVRSLCYMHERPAIVWEYETPFIPLPADLCAPVVRGNNMKQRPLPPQEPVLATPPSTPPRGFETPDYFIVTPRAVQSERKPLRPIRLKFDDL